MMLVMCYSKLQASTRCSVKSSSVSGSEKTYPLIDSTLEEMVAVLVVRKLRGPGQFNPPVNVFSPPRDQARWGCRQVGRESEQTSCQLTV